MLEQLSRGEVGGLELVHQVAQIANLLGEQLLNSREILDYLRGVPQTTAQRLDLHLEGHERLNDTVVEFSCDARALERAHPRP